MILGYRVSNSWAGNLSGQSYDDMLSGTSVPGFTESATVYLALQVSSSDVGPYDDAATVYFDLTVSTADEYGHSDAATVYLDLTAGGTDVHTTPTIYTDADTIYLDIRVRGQEEGVFYETFETLDAWDQTDWETENANQLYISRKHATDGPSSLRITYDTVYGGQGFFLQWIDLVNGGDPAKTYWLTYSFYLESWERMWQDGLGGGGNEAYLGVNVLPGFAHTDTHDDYSAPFVLKATSQTTGDLIVEWPFSDPSQTISLTPGMWHTVKIGMQMDTGTGDAVTEAWVDGVQVSSEILTGVGGYPNPPMGVDIFQTQSRAAGVVYIDELTYSVDSEPNEAAGVESGDGTTTQEWIKIRDKYSGTSADVDIEIDPTFTGAVSEAWVFADIYIPQSLLSALTPGDETHSIITTTSGGSGNDIFLKIRKVGGVYKLRQSFDTEFGSITAGWHSFAWHHLAGQTQYELRVDGTVYNVWVGAAHTELLAPIDYVSVNNPKFRTVFTPINDSQNWIGVDELAVSFDGWVREDNYDLRFPMQSIEFADIVYPPVGDPPSYPPYYASAGPGDNALSLEEGGIGPGPGLPDAITVEGVDAFVYLDLQASGVDISSVTPDAATIPLRFSVSYAQAYGSADFGTVYLDLQVQGGECFSTAQIEVEGDAYLRWTADANYRWLADASPRWLAEASREGGHC